MNGALWSFRRYWLCWTACVLAILAIVAPQSAAQQGALSLPRSQLEIETGNGRFAFDVELAATPAARQRGLMFRDHLADDHGMLFDFGEPQRVTMWMRNTYISLDILFIREDGRISTIAERAEPLSDTVIASDEPVRAVLELRGGITSELGISPGDRIVHPLFDRP